MRGSPVVPPGSLFISCVKGTSETLSILETDITTEHSSKQSVPLGIHTWEPDQKVIHNRSHIVCAVLHVIVSEAMLMRQAVHLQEDGHNLNECILDESKLANWIHWNEAKIYVI